MKGARLVNDGSIAALERGVSLLGSGGGGQTDVMAELLRVQLGARGQIRLLGVEELPPDALVLPVGVVGATALFTEKLPSGAEFAAVVRALATSTRRAPDAVMPFEAGGLNGITPFVVAAQSDLPVVDADLMGRALPRLDQFSLAAVGRSLTPLALADASGWQLVLDGVGPTGAERIVRAILATAGGWSACAVAPIPARDLPTVALVGSLSRALRLGAVHLATSQETEPTRVADALEGRALSSGRVVEVVRQVPHPGFGRGHLTVRTADDGTLLRLEMENEYLLALADGAPVASTPDLICLLDHRTGATISTDAVHTGLDVHVLQLPAPPFWCAPDRLDRVGPRAFGLDQDPVLLQRSGELS